MKSHMNFYTPENLRFKKVFEYLKVASFNTSHLEARAALFRLLMKGIFDPYVLLSTFRQKVDFLISNAC